LKQKKNRIKVIACATVIEEMQPYLAPGTSSEVLDFGLHLIPEKLREVLQEAIDKTSHDFDVILLGYGMCSMAVVGLFSDRFTLVVPRVDDCIAIFLGSREEYRIQSNKDPGTYYLTKGWIEVGDSPFEEHDRLIELYGAEKAERVMKMMLKNYTRLAYINTGREGDEEKYRQYTYENAEKYGLRYEEIRGSNSLIKKMLLGPWDDDFIVVRPGKKIVFSDFR